MRNEARKWAIPFGIELASLSLVMFLHSSIVAWSNDRRGCVVYETEGGWIVQMTLGGFSTIEQPCASAREGLTVARGWRATCDESFAIGPKAA